MAKIALFTESLPSQNRFGEISYEIGSALAEQQNDVKIFTTFNNEVVRPAHVRRLEVLCPIEKWSAFEAPKVWSLLYEFQPDIIYMIQPHGREINRFLNLFHLLPQRFPFLPKALKLLSLFDLSGSAFHIHRYLSLFHACDCVTVLNQLQRSIVIRETKNVDQERIKILQPVMFPISNINQHICLPEGFPNRYLIIPGSLSEHFDLTFLFSFLQAFIKNNPSMGIVISGSQRGISLRKRRQLFKPLIEGGYSGNLFFTGPLSQDEEAHLMKKSSLVFLSSLPPEGLVFSDSVNRAVWAHAPFIVTDLQAENHLLLQQNKIKYLRASYDLNAQVCLAQQAIREEVQWPQGRGSVGMYLLGRDELGNQLNRLFSQDHSS